MIPMRNMTSLTRLELAGNPLSTGSTRDEVADYLCEQIPSIKDGACLSDPGT